MVFSMKLSKDEAIKRINHGEVIALATDTIYGLVAKYNDLNAIEEIFTLKRRPLTNPLIVLIHDLDDLKKFTHDPPEGLDKIAEAFWPGPLTVILPVIEEAINKTVRANLPTCAFRIPGNKDLLSIIEKTGPIVAPSANISENTPAKNRKEIEFIFGESFPVYGEQTIEENLPSTLIGHENERWVVFREGKLKKQELEKVIGYMLDVK